MNIHHSRCMPIILAASLVLVTSCRSQKEEEAGASAATPGAAEPAAVLITAGRCEGELLGWLTNGLGHGVPQVGSTERGCDMTFDVSGAPIDDVKDIVGRGLQERGFLVAKSVPARRGERITFKDQRGQQIDVLFRGKDNVQGGACLMEPARSTCIGTSRRTE